MKSRVKKSAGAGPALKVPVDKIKGKTEDEKKVKREYLGFLAKLLRKNGQTSPVRLEAIAAPENGKAFVTADIESLVTLLACKRAGIGVVDAVIFNWHKPMHTTAVAKKKKDIKIVKPETIFPSTENTAAEQTPSPEEKSAQTNTVVETSTPLPREFTDPFNPLILGDHTRENRRLSRTQLR